MLQYARTVKAKGLKLLVDFHYSDTWADPGMQTKPAAWASHGISQLQTDVYNYTYDVCTSLKAQGTTPDSVQIGNEINVGMLWNDGRVVNNDFTNLGLLLKAGLQRDQGVQQRHPGDHPHRQRGQTARPLVLRRHPGPGRGLGHHRPVVLLHVARHAGQPRPTSSPTCAPGTASRSSSPRPRTRSPPANADSTGNASQQRACSGYPPPGRPGQAKFTAVQNTARNAGAIGVFYWEPTWYAVPGNGWDPANINDTGNGWDNMAIFDWSGRLNPNIRWRP